MVKNHKADSFEGVRAASLIEPVVQPGLSELTLSGFLRKQVDAMDDEDARALALAIMALSSDND